MRRETRRAHEAALLLEKKAKVSDIDAHWEGSYDGLLEYWDDTSPETTAFALKLLITQDRASGLLPKAAQWLAGHRDGDYWYSTKQTAMVIEGLTEYRARERRTGQLVRRGSAGEWRERGQAALWAGRWICTAVAHPGSSGAGGRRRAGDDSQERQWDYVLVGGERVVLGRQAALPARQAGAEHYARLLPAAEAAGQADRSDHV